MKKEQWYNEFKTDERMNVIGQNGNDGEHYESETLEEAMERYAELTYVYPLEKAKTFDKEPQIELLKRQFQLGAKWQQNNMYSEKEVYNLLLKYQNEYTYVNNVIGLMHWLKQFKKK